MSKPRRELPEGWWVAPAVLFTWLVITVGLIIWRVW
jgi:hypothetical protein